MYDFDKLDETTAQRVDSLEARAALNQRYGKFDEALRLLDAALRIVMQECPEALLP